MPSRTDKFIDIRSDSNGLNREKCFPSRKHLVKTAEVVTLTRVQTLQMRLKSLDQKLFFRGDSQYSHVLHSLHVQMIKRRFFLFSSLSMTSLCDTKVSH